jgi:hypothetical protein
VPVLERLKYVVRLHNQLVVAYPTGAAGSAALNMAILLSSTAAPAALVPLTAV